MNRNWKRWLWGGLIVVGASYGNISAGRAAENPFAVIVARNVFRLQPFAIPTHIVQEAPPKVLPRIVVTGLTDVCGRRQALMEITEKGQPVVRPVLVEGEAFGGIDVVRIDIGLGEVTVRVQGEELELELQPPRPAVAVPTIPALAVRR